MPIVQAGDPVLRHRATPVDHDQIGSRAVQELIAALHRALVETPGVGIAAPQIGVSLRVVVVQDPPDFHESVPPEWLAVLERTPIDPYVLINPELDRVGDEERTFFEGCLSIEGYRALVPRRHSVRVRYMTPQGDRQEETRSGWHARILQHEVDHLDGCLYVDRMLSRSLTSTAHYERWAHVPTHDVCSAFGIND